MREPCSRCGRPTVGWADRPHPAFDVLCAGCWADEKEHGPTSTPLED